MCEKFATGHVEQERSSRKYCNELKEFTTANYDSKNDGKMNMYSRPKNVSI